MAFDKRELTICAAAIAPAIRAALGGIVCFELCEELSAETFETVCQGAQLSGALCDVDNISDTEAIYSTIKELASEDGAEDVQLIGVCNLGYFCIGESKNAAEAVRASVISRNPIPESFSISSSDQRLSGKVAIVTGAAQGFGEGIANEMLEQGAYIVIADLNEELASRNAQAINKKYNSFRALAVKVDVSNEASVEDMIARTVTEFGGLDILISNAGVLKAGSLEEMSVENFEFVTKINYTAFFVCTKYAARPMRIAHKINRNIVSDIIQINSKSGLEGSNKNFAYAGGKFGGIGLVQSFAKELVDDGIKVNAICPGNFYEGPLWSDPDRGLFVQYLSAGKVPGAKTIEDVRKAYIDKVPMKRGCSPKDVARAVFYIVEQEYETGQAIPVTGGQNMLR